MDDQFFSAFKRYQEQQERINNLMRSPAMEMIKKQQESMQRIIGSSVNASLLNQKENVRLIVKSPAFDMLQKHQENWANIMGSSAVMAFENNLGVKTVLGNQLFDNWSEQQKRINKMINPTINTILVEHQERWNSIFQKVSDFGINYSIFEEIVEELKEVYEEIDDDTVPVPSANEEVSSQKTRKEIQEFKKQLEDIISYCMYVLGIIHVVDKLSGIS
ncbi:hypothetical protein HXA35_06930 [Bacillus sp. A301a_S52]|jgi:L-rhamnose mutarotase|nr:hypothetical protein [Bacillus sp. A301a_S52]